MTLRKKIVTQVNVKWKQFAHEKASWEMEDALRMVYPSLFQEYNFE